MCGICGQVRSDWRAPVDQALIGRMMESIKHRGPDGRGTYFADGAGLGHVRLAIIDLVTGQQPIFDESGEIAVVFNGEIYNYQELRNRLVMKGHVLRTTSDTEVIVHLYEEMGAEVAKELRGMFAFALWDNRSKRLLLARDRVGIKPLYYLADSEGLLFASELKAILESPRACRRVNAPVLSSFMAYTYAPGTETMLEGIHKLPPGHTLVYEGGKTVIRQYWDLLSFSRQSGEPGRGSVSDLVELLGESVRLHGIADVPVGFLLSGGIDSTSLLHLASESWGNHIRTFTIGFEGYGIEDERFYARLAAERYGSTHLETTISGEDFFDFLPRYVWHMEEPVCEPPAVSLYYVSKMAREHVKVLISGEGGDEAFGGYQKYRNLLFLEQLRRLLGPLAGALSAGTDGRATDSSGKLARYASLMRFPFEDYYYSFASSPLSFFNAHRKDLYAPGFLPRTLATSDGAPFRSYLADSRGRSQLSRMLYVDTKTWLPDHLLVKADKMTMANSLELRVPLLDHKVLEFAAGLPDSQKVHLHQTKRIVKKAFARDLPREILKRRKAGFLTPFDRWFADHKDHVLGILSDRRCVERGYFDSAALRRLVIDPWRDRGERSVEVFGLVTLELWHRAFVDRRAIA